MSCARRFRRREGDANARDRPWVQTIPHVRDDQHRRHGRLFPVRELRGCRTYTTTHSTTTRLIPETKGRSLEEMDIIFGAVQEDKRKADIAVQERGRYRTIQSSTMIVLMCS